MYWFVRATYVLLIQQSRYVCILFKYLILTEEEFSQLTKLLSSLIFRVCMQKGWEQIKIILKTKLKFILNLIPQGISLTLVVCCKFLQPCEPTLQERDEQCKARGYSADGHNFGGVGKETTQQSFHNLTWIFCTKKYQPPVIKFILPYY